MQIVELVLYGYNGKVRHLPFSIGKVNVIPGRSKSGKSAVGDIIEYCLGGTSCNIADGVVRDCVAWYGLLLQFQDERVFIARKNPDPGQQTTSFCYIEIGKNIDAPAKCNFTSNANISSIEETLSARLGISENLHTPPEGQSRNSLSANIRHALFYCFQGQDEIAAKNTLFHRQTEAFIPQAIKDTLPYFLGAVDEQFLALDGERNILKRQLVIEKRKLEENRALMGGGTDRAIRLIGEARQVGLIDGTVTTEHNDYSKMQEILKSAIEWTPTTVNASGMDRLSFLQEQLAQTRTELDSIEFSLSEAKVYSGEAMGFNTEAHHQKKRLESIGLFESLDFNTGNCPFCSGKLEHPLPGVEAMKQSIVVLDQAISNVSKEHPKLQAFIDSLEQDRQKKREYLHSLEAEIDGIYEAQECAQQIRDLNARRARVVGRISLWLESVENDVNSEKQELVIQRIENRMREIDELISIDAQEERKQSALSRIQVDMTAWAKLLELEHCNNPYRLDLNKVTVVVDKPERPVPLKQLGSGSNWVGVHLITYFALHKLFIEGNRPVPNFLFIDQPSQVYFPSEIEEERTDWDEVNKMYQFIFDRVRALNGAMQVIIVDHANLDNEDFRTHTVDSWLSKDRSLVPNDWITTPESEAIVLYEND